MRPAVYLGVDERKVARTAWRFVFESRRLNTCGLETTLAAERRSNAKPTPDRGRKGAADIGGARMLTAIEAALWIIGTMSVGCLYAVAFDKLRRI